MVAADWNVNSTPYVTINAVLQGVRQTMDTCIVTVLNPNLVPVIGPVTPSQISTGVYQYTLPVGLVKLIGRWSAVFYYSKGTLTNEIVETFLVGTGEQ
jgi:hypothetical protein